MEKHHSCLNTRAIIEYFQEKLPETVPRLLADLGPEIAALADPLEFLMEINNWVSSDVIIKMFDNAREITHRGNIAFEIGFQSAARKKLGYVQRIIMFAHKNPRRTLQRVQAINDKFNKNKVIEVLETSRDRAVIRLHWFRHIPGIIDFCMFNQGIYAGIPTIWDLPPARVLETKCFFKGDEYCEYHLHWQRRPSWKDSCLRLLVPWSLLKSTIAELERDKDLLAKKFNEVHRLNLQLREKVDQLICLHQTSTAALSLLDLEEILQVSLRFLVTSTSLDQACLFLLDDREKVLELKYATGVDPEVWARIKGHGIPLTQEDHIIAQAARSGSPVVIPDCSGDRVSRLDWLWQQLPVKAGFLAPLVVRHQVLGVILGLQRRQSQGITATDKEFVMSFANHLAIALEKVKLYQRLEASERRYRGLVENAHEGIWIAGADGVITFANRRMKEITGDEALEGKVLAAFWDPQHLRLIDNILRQNREGKVVQKELEIISLNRGPVAVSMSSVPLMENGRFQGAFAMFSDLSDKKEMERQLWQHQKMEAIGALAGGVAHNFNNILMNIMGLNGLLLADMDPRQPAYADLKHIEQEVLKGAELTRQLLALGRGGKPSRRPLNLNSLIDKVVRLFCRTHGEITLTRHLAPLVPAVEADAGQMEQVMLNLLVNAGQAMHGRGEITVTTREVVLDEDFCRAYDRPAGAYIQVSLTDSGPGMDEATRDRIFEPFFTTKKQGTGLGLVTVYAIMKNHRGLIKVDSKPGQGTTFHLYLPVCHRPAVAGATPRYRLVKGSGTILLVDDESSVRTVGQRILEQLGYEVLPAESGAQAVEIYQEASHRIHLVLLDLNLPGMGGKEIFQRLREINPRVKVLLCSGYSMEDTAQTMMDAGAQGFIQKPYRLDDLSHKIKEILGSEESGKQPRVLSG